MFYKGGGGRYCDRDRNPVIFVKVQGSRHRHSLRVACIFYMMTSILNLNYHIDDKNIFEKSKEIALQVKPNWKSNDINFKVNFVLSV